MEDKSVELRKFSDDELLMELRRRKRFVRARYQTLVPFYRGVENPPDHYIYSRAFEELGYEIGKRYLEKEFTIPGMKREIENEDMLMSRHRITIPLTFVVD